MTRYTDLSQKARELGRIATAGLHIRLRDERGQALLEYALIISFVAVACVAALTFKLPAFVNGVFDQMSSKFP